MQRQDTDTTSAAIESRVRELVGRERTLTFTALTATLSDCRWISLFRALHRLEKQRVVRLTPLPSDYQISLAAGTIPAPRVD